MPIWLKLLMNHPAYWDEILGTFFVVAASWIAARIYILVIDKVGRRWARRTASTLDDGVLAAVRKPGAILVFLVGIYGAIHRYKFPLINLVDGILFVLSVAVVIYTLIAILEVIVAWYSVKIAGGEGENVAREFLPLVDKMIKVIAGIIGLVVILDRFRIDIKSILVTLGVGSLAIGLALQETLANMFGGFTIMLDRPFRVGDRIQLQTGEIGDVQGIGMRSTSLAMPDGNLLIVPNSLLVKTIVINLSYPDTRAVIQIPVGVAYGSDITLVKKLMLEAARETIGVLQDPIPSVFLKSFGETSLNMLMVCRVASYADVMAATDAMNTAISAEFEAAGIAIARPVRLLVGDGLYKSPTP